MSWFNEVICVMGKRRNSFGLKLLMLLGDVEKTREAQQNPLINRRSTMFEGYCCSVRVSLEIFKYHYLKECIIYYIPV